MNKMMKTGIELIAEERQRQIEKEGWTPEHDARHDTGDLAHAAAAYASAELYRRTTSPGYNNTPPIWPFESTWWKPTPENRIRELQKAGALIAAEIDRLNALKALDTTKLHACPFCGKKPYQGRDKNGHHVAKCYTCSVQMTQDREDKLEGLWNNREQINGI
ncbi:hypothetical protein LAG90_15750 [Marinilongibacter aquaticus]|uniref:hypothetical protein n=1 Tax=Marinilongibacter aquaticus TaxID=2975157 RepID=UPI0021BD27BF|nr:hypothetical protein [Marinilongibacter aquaticus]UBM58258.1 hypothetical protein LAG90_15750 [Marinilongibacter aquaticus]